MRKWLKVSLVVFVSIVILYSVFLWQEQAPSYEKHSTETMYVDERSEFEEWLDSYLDMHTYEYNFRNKIDQYEIESIEELYQEEEQSDILSYQVYIEGKAEKSPLKLFKTEPFFDEGEFNYNIVLNLEYIEDKLVYVSDKTYDKYRQELDEQYRPYAIDSLKDLYQKNNMNLEVRESVESPWIKTPLEIEKFNPQSGGWYRDDQRIYFEEDEIAILHYGDKSRMAVTQSIDGGVTWKTNDILSTEDVGAFPISFGYINFVGNEGVVALSSVIAGSSEIMTLYRTLDNGDTWEAGIVPDYTPRPHMVSFVDSGRIFVTFNDDPVLHVTEDLGETYQDIEIPDHQLLKKDYLTDSELEWSDFYIQAEPPFIRDGKYYMHMSQGENGDYNYVADALYSSDNRGKTWEFIQYDYPVEEEEEN